MSQAALSPPNCQATATHRNYSQSPGFICYVPQRLLSANCLQGPQIKPVQVTEHASKLNTTLHLPPPWIPPLRQNQQAGIASSLSASSYCSGPDLVPHFSLTATLEWGPVWSYHDVGGYNHRVITHRLDEKHLEESKAKC